MKNNKDQEKKDKPIHIPTCSVCGKPFTQCKCTHNDLKK